VERDIDKAKEWSLKGALQFGDPQSMYTFAMILLQSEEGMQVGLGWLSHAAEAGHTRAMYELGKFCKATKDKKWAFSWTSDAAEDDNLPEAQIELGCGCKKSKSEAKKCLQMEARRQSHFSVHGKTSLSEFCVGWLFCSKRQNKRVVIISKSGHIGRHFFRYNTGALAS